MTFQENNDFATEKAKMAEEISAQIANTVSAPPLKKNRPMRAIVFRGLAVILPPLLTIVIILWIGATIRSYVIDPIFRGSRDLIVFFSADVVTQQDLSPQDLVTGKAGDERVTLKNNKNYVRISDGNYIPETIYEDVSQELGMEAMPTTCMGIYQRHVEETYLNPYIFVPALFLLFFFIVYLIGKLIAAGIGRFLWRYFEYGFEKVPLVSTVYGAVKNVVHLLFTEKEMRFSRVVAVEWPRKGVWVLAMVTGQGIPDIENHVGEEFCSIFLPTAPVPMTGFILNVKKSETLELSITVDQAIQFLVSCGVVVPGKAMETSVIPNPNDEQA